MSSAPDKRWYDDACGTAHALELIGERWALLVMRELMLGPKRFGMLRADLPGISANVLTQRLEGLEAAGLLVKRQLPAPISTQVYELTPWGYEAEVFIRSMGRWAARSPAHDASLPISTTSMMLSLKTNFIASRAKGVTADVGLRVGSEVCRARVRAGAIEVERGDVQEADVVLTAEAGALADAIYGGAPLARLERQKLLRVEGDRAVAERFVGLFALPDKA